MINALGVQGSNTGDTLLGIVGSLAGHYALGGAIDATSTSSWNGGLGFTPLGNGTTAFTGTLAGLGHWIKGVTVTRPSASYIGLFGAVGSGGEVRDVAAIEVNMSGLANVGGLVGQNNGRVANSMSAGQVVGTNNLIGGLLGDNSTTGTVTRSYSTATATGAAQVGGFSGNNGGAISYSYSTGNVIGDTNSGGFVGYNNGAFGATIANSYASGSITGSGANVGNFVGYAGGSGITNSAGGVNPTTASTFAGWDFTNTWTIYQGDTTPLLSAFLLPLNITLATSKTYNGGTGADWASLS